MERGASPTSPALLPDLDGIACDLFVGLVAAADGHVDVRVGRVVVVVDRHPIEPRPEVPLHGVHHAARVVHQVEGLAPLGRENHLPEPRVLGPLPALEAAVDLDLVPGGVEAEPLLPLALGSFAGQVAAVGAPAAGRSVGHVLELHDASLLTRARAVPRPLQRTAGGAGASLAMSDARRDLAQEQTASLAPLGPDASEPDATCALGRIFAVTLHARSQHKSRGRCGPRRAIITRKLAARERVRNPGPKCARPLAKRSPTSGRFILAFLPPTLLSPHPGLPASDHPNRAGFVRRALLG